MNQLGNGDSESIRVEVTVQVLMHRGSHRNFDVKKLIKNKIKKLGI